MIRITLLGLVAAFSSIAFAGQRGGTNFIGNASGADEYTLSPDDIAALMHLPPPPPPPK